jgi:D-alanine-D-alanine ligase-like ATP-grasp enzyme
MVPRDYVALRAGSLDLDLDQRGLGLPVFVKPARGGSSTGVTKVHDRADLVSALDTARRYDPKVLVEAAIAPRQARRCGCRAHARAGRRRLPGRRRAGPGQGRLLLRP